MPFRNCFYAHILVARGWGSPEEGCVAGHLVKTFSFCYLGHCLMQGVPQSKSEAQMGTYCSELWLLSSLFCFLCDFEVLTWPGLSSAEGVWNCIPQEEAIFRHCLLGWT